MSKSTFRVIILLVTLLFLNIEAAQAGLIGKLRLYIDSEFSHSHLALFCLAAGIALFVAYVIFSPVPMHGRHHTLRGLPGSMRGFDEKKDAVRRIADRLRREPGIKRAGSPDRHRDHRVRRAA